MSSENCDGRPDCLAFKRAYGRHLYWCHVASEPTITVFPPCRSECCALCDLPVEDDPENHVFIAHVRRPKYENHRDP